MKWPTPRIFKQANSKEHRPLRLQFQFDFWPGKFNIVWLVSPTWEIVQFDFWPGRSDTCSVPVVRQVSTLCDYRRQVVHHLEVVPRIPVQVREFTNCSSKGLSVASALDSSRFRNNSGQSHSSWGFSLVIFNKE